MSETAPGTTCLLDRDDGSHQDVSCLLRARARDRAEVSVLHSFAAKRSVWQRLLGKKPAAPVAIAAIAMTTLRGH